MILVDTDHATFLKYPESERGRRLIDRLTAVPSSEVVGVAIITVEERMRGTGPYAEMLARRFHIAVKRLGLNQPSKPLDVAKFRKPARQGDQLALF